MTRSNLRMIALVAAALAGSSVAAVAAEQTKGIVEQVDASRGTLRLQSGETFTFANPAVLYGLLPGERVGVSHDGADGIAAFDPHPAHQMNIDVD
ncbi:MAG TPA: hypothetical protein VNX29_19785 [Kaistia sp.]|nr:hypothetical protein [Kaistia sp.]